PQLIAGPIVHHEEVIGQYRDDRRFRLRWDTVAVGIAFFVAGLFKKVVLADSLAPTADSVFDAAAAGAPILTADAWLGALAYTLQLYFDFSGYSDMAIGLGWLFGVRLPVNFNAPYQADSIIDFWRRWHITLSRFLRDYLYIPLGGSRCGATRRYINLFLTMLLGGLWHGAGWTFVLWGGLHGLYLAINHGWRAFVTHLSPRSSPVVRDNCPEQVPGSDKVTHSRLPAVFLTRIAGRLLTLAAVIAGWVVFRAENLTAAGQLFSSLTGTSPAATGLQLVEEDMVMQLVLLFAAVQFLPTTQSLIPSPATDPTTAPAPAWDRRLMWRPTPLHATFLSAAVVLCVMLLTRVKEFLYFQF
ncbi:MAG: MBOAT family protein, partial [Planctomycetaceae bacterium]|nr:MBOAT family protein [Planctomycetaceae bacterium]